MFFIHFITFLLHFSFTKCDIYEWWMDLANKLDFLCTWIFSCAIFRAYVCVCIGWEYSFTPIQCHTVKMNSSSILTVVALDLYMLTHCESPHFKHRSIFVAVRFNGFHWMCGMNTSVCHRFFAVNNVRVNIWPPEEQTLNILLPNTPTNSLLQEFVIDEDMRLAIYYARHLEVIFALMEQGVTNTTYEFGCVHYWTEIIGKYRPFFWTAERMKCLLRCQNVTLVRLLVMKDNQRSWG